MRPENDWYDGRAVAESSKTLAWRYAACGLPFPITEPEPDAALSEQISDLLSDAPDLSLQAVGAAIVTQDMSDLRGKCLEERKAAYLDGRIRDQEAWYVAKARYNADRSTKWRLVLIFLELAGVTGVTLKAVGLIEIDIAGIATAAIGSGAAWLAVKQHDSIARAYAFAANELLIVERRLDEVTEEDAWSFEVASAEEAISREHTMWRAARLTPVPKPDGSRLLHKSRHQ